MRAWLPLLCTLLLVGVGAAGALGPALPATLRWCLRRCKAALDATFEALLWDVYFNGALLFWNGSTEADICASMTGVRSDHWVTSENASECTFLIQGKFHALVTMCTTPLLLCGLYRLASSLVWFVCVWHPAAASREADRRALRQELGRQSPLRQIMAAMLLQREGQHRLLADADN